uniref:Activin_recp domain-containing protein n=1 Tax=Syphacia muris TaxID=451379 RepID=A0A0N5AQH8_9BILA
MLNFKSKICLCSGSVKIQADPEIKLGCNDDSNSTCKSGYCYTTLQVENNDVLWDSVNNVCDTEGFCNGSSCWISQKQVACCCEVDKCQMNMTETIMKQILELRNSSEDNDDETSSEENLRNETNVPDVNETVNDTMEQLNETDGSMELLKENKPADSFMENAVSYENTTEMEEVIANNTSEEEDNSEEEATTLLQTNETENKSNATAVNSIDLMKASNETNSEKSLEDADEEASDMDETTDNIQSNNKTSDSEENTSAAVDDASNESNKSLETTTEVKILSNNSESLESSSETSVTSNSSSSEVDSTTAVYTSTNFANDVTSNEDDSEESLENTLTAQPVTDNVNLTKLTDKLESTTTATVAATVSESNESQSGKHKNTSLEDAAPVSSEESTESATSGNTITTTTSTQRPKLAKVNLLNEPLKSSDDDNSAEAITETSKPKTVRTTTDSVLTVSPRHRTKSSDSQRLVSGKNKRAKEKRITQELKHTKASPFKWWMFVVLAMLICCGISAIIAFVLLRKKSVNVTLRVPAQEMTLLKSSDDENVRQDSRA